MKQKMKKREVAGNEKKIAMRVSVVSIVINLILSLFKFLAGIFAASGAMISDAVHSASDVFSTIIVMIGVSIADKKSDREHPYGHERMECVASILLAIVLAITGIGIGITGVQNIFGAGSDELKVPGLLALIAAIVSIAVKEWMYWYTRFAAKRINSGALMADAWHHRSDALSSVGALIGIAGARLGLPILDPIASLVICVFIEKAALDIFRDSVNKMVDKSCSDEVVNTMREMILSQKGVIGIDALRTRLFGSRIYVEAEITAESSKTLTEAHEIAEEVHRAIETAFPNVKHCMVHVSPAEDEEIKKNDV